MATNPRPVEKFTLDIAAEVRATRARIGMSQETLAERAGISVHTMSKIERGLSAIDMEQFARIAAALNLAPDVLMASAMRNAALHTPEGALNPAAVSGIRESDAHIADLAAQSDEISPDGE